jgi:hypothetical protein
MDSGGYYALSAQWSSFTTALTSFPDRIYDAAVGMATSFQRKIDEYRVALSQPPSTDGGDARVVIYHRKALDRLRRERPGLYARLLDLSHRERLLTDPELRELAGA